MQAVVCMARSATSIQAEITTLEAFLASDGSTIVTQGANGVSATRIDRTAAAKRLDELYQHLGRADGSSPMLVRGRLTGQGNYSLG